MSDLFKSILKTLCYADVFDYPLRYQEMAKFQISNSKFQMVRQADHSNHPERSRGINSKLIKRKDGFYYLKGREGLIEIRKKRESWSREKMKIAKEVGSWLKLIPTVKMAAVSGALAMNNAKEGDDIDLLVVASDGWFWTTRFLTTVLVELVAKRRRPADSEFRDKICLNMFLDEGHLAVPAAERDLFSAHEAAQVKVLWAREAMYEKFMAANSWLTGYLPNSKIPKIHTYLRNDRCSVKRVFLSFIEGLLKRAQLIYMQKRRTHEIIKDGYIRFHPKDARKWVLKEYHKRLKKYGVG